MAKFPPLPDTPYSLYYEWPDDEDGYGGSEVIGEDGYTAHQLRARDLEIWRMAMEAAADVCEQLAWPGRNHSDYIQGQNDLSDKAATAIRALPEPSHQ